MLISELPPRYRALARYRQYLYYTDKQRLLESKVATRRDLESVDSFLWVKTNEGADFWAATKQALVDDDLPWLPEGYVHRELKTILFMQNEI